MSNIVRRNSFRIILALPLMLGLMSTTAFAADDPLTGSWQLVKRKLPDGTIQIPPVVGGMNWTPFNGRHEVRRALSTAGRFGRLRRTRNRPAVGNAAPHHSDVAFIA